MHNESVSSAAQRLVASFDRFVPSELTDPAARQRCQLVVLLALVGVAVAGTFAAGGPYMGIGLAPILVFATIALVIAIVPFLLRATRSLDLGAHVVVAMWFASVVCGIYVRGGLDNPSSMALAPIPLLATVLAGWRSGLLWMLASLAMLVVLAIAPTLGIELADQIEVGKRSAYAWASVVMMLVALSLLAAGVLAVIGVSRESLADAVRKGHAAENRAQMLRAGRLAALGEVASSLAHEINNPLMYVMANLEFVGEDPRLPSDIFDAVGDAHDGSKRIASIVRDLKAYASHDDESIEQVDLAVVAQSTARLVRGYVRRRANLVLDFQPCPSVDGNWAHLGQVVINLVVNACHAIEKGDPEKNEVRISTGVADDRPFLSVLDTGCGISPEDLKRITEPFYTTGDGSGTGLGLTVTRNIVEDLGGSIAIESVVGKGTTVAVSLPKTTGEPSRERRLTLPASLSNLSIVLIDEDPLIGAALGRMLAGHRLTVAQTIDEADRFLADHTPDLIMVDVPGSGDRAILWFEALLENDQKLSARTVLLSGGAEPRLEVHKERLVLKPISREDLRGLIFRHVIVKES